MPKTATRADPKPRGSAATAASLLAYLAGTFPDIPATPAAYADAFGRSRSAWSNWLRGAPVTPAIARDVRRMAAFLLAQRQAGMDRNGDNGPTPTPPARPAAWPTPKGFLDGGLVPSPPPERRYASPFPPDMLQAPPADRDDGKPRRGWPNPYFNDDAPKLPPPRNAPPPVVYAVAVAPDAAAHFEAVAAALGASLVKAPA